MDSICIIGDSHAAALKLGWDTTGNELPDVNIEFFVALRQFLFDFEIRDGKLVASSEDLKRRVLRTSNGKVEIHGHYNAFVVCAVDAGIDRVWRRFGAFSVLESPKPADEQTLRQSLYSDLAKTDAVKFLNIVRKITSAPILLIGKPYPAPERATKWLERFGDRSRLHFFSECYSQTYDRVLSETCNARFVPQPVQTVDPDCPVATADRFFRSPARIFAFDGDDRIHANAEYGDACLRSALAILNES